ncbi:hypothetical protein V8F33_007445 [Rhypophila sp. PSN 637]
MATQVRAHCPAGGSPALPLNLWTTHPSSTGRSLLKKSMKLTLAQQAWTMPLLRLCIIRVHCAGQWPVVWVVRRWEDQSAPIFAHCLAVQPCGEDVLSGCFDWLPQSVKHHEAIPDLHRSIGSPRNGTRPGLLCIHFVYPYSGTEREGCTMVKYFLVALLYGARYGLHTDTVTVHLVSLDCGWFLGNMVVHAPGVSCSWFPKLPDR